MTEETASAIDVIALRRHLRAARRALSPAAQQAAAEAVAVRIRALPAYAAARSIAVYLACDGELDPAVLVAGARRDGRTLLLPRLLPEAGRMDFAEWPADAPLVANRFGIPEPEGTPLHAPEAVDLVLAPLVGFDAHGGRLGMGGGYYDRSFAFLLARPRPSRPYLVGLAHACQRVDRLEVRPWDVPLDAVVSDTGGYPQAA
ncbi:5-formyltetrahydrofolate cyclo-ligase [Plasticicumulans sp.]|uniref:5-formyltetrahydrofolate cyclo-ligase n=1 Tax=Plasticicumulans sp. TaxID=2307179 RepID=UPI002CB6BF57|nr:5-formyltetrahydrofolate cyclo-ligase [Plasticicumulans sp.]HNM43397.1 5-formyltetrahydrofolate cyclo-ligase [Plasticicumulans sp.]